MHLRGAQQYPRPLLLIPSFLHPIVFTWCWKLWDPIAKSRGTVLKKAHAFPPHGSQFSQVIATPEDPLVAHPSCDWASALSAAQGGAVFRKKGKTEGLGKRRWHLLRQVLRSFGLPSLGVLRSPEAEVVGSGWDCTHDSSPHSPRSLSAAQVPDSDEQFVPDFHSENCE